MTDPYPYAFAVVWNLENPGGTVSVVNKASDPGGLTIGGVALSRNPDLSESYLRSLSVADFGPLYKARWWTPYGCDQLPWPLNLIVFDGEVNQGANGAKSLQEALGGLLVDGVIGPKTLAAVAGCNLHWTSIVTLRQRAKHYLSTGGFAANGDGWFDRLFAIGLAAGIPPT